MKSLTKKSKSKFVKLLIKKAAVLRINLLVFLELEEIVKFGLICKDAYDLIDPNSSVQSS